MARPPRRTHVSGRCAFAHLPGVPRHPPMTSPTGLPTNALFGFARDLLFLRERKPDYLVCAFDRRRADLPQRLYPTTRPTAPPMPDDLQLAVAADPASRRGAAAFPSLSAAGFEADDVIATVARAASQRGLDVFICTSDKDCRQLHRRPRPPLQPAQAAEFGRAGAAGTTGASRRSRSSTSSRWSATRWTTCPACPASASRRPPSCCRSSARSTTSWPTSTRSPGPSGRRTCAPAAAKDQISRQLVRLDDRRADRRSTGTTGGCGPWTSRALLGPVPRVGLPELRRPGPRRDAATAAAPPSSAAVRRRASCSPSAPTPSGRRTPRPTRRTADEAIGPTDGWQATYHLVDTPEKFDGFLRAS